MEIKGLKKASGFSSNFSNGLENHIYFDKHNGIVWCKHETQGSFTLYSNAKLILKSKKHISMNEIKEAIATETNKRYFIKIIMKANENNDIYYGNVLESIFGKNFNWIENIGSHATDTNCVTKFDIDKARKCGFATVQEAKKSSVWRSAENENSLWDLLLMEVIEINL